MASVKGDKQLIKALGRLASPATQRKATRPAVKEAAGVVRDEIRAKAPSATGTLKRSITTRMKTSRGGVVFAKIGALNRKYANGQNPAHYAHLVEYGSKSHLIGKPGQVFVLNGSSARGPLPHPGARPRPFMRPGFDSSVTKAQKVMARRLWQEIKKAASKG